MAFRSKPTANSYVEIARRTVANPDFSYRPSLEAEQLARHRFGEVTEHRPHPLSPREVDLRDRVRAALAADGNLALDRVTVDVDDAEIILTGFVPGPATAIRIQELAGAVAGVERVDNQLIVRVRGGV